MCEYNAKYTLCCINNSREIPGINVPRLNENGKEMETTHHNDKYRANELIKEVARKQGCTSTGCIQ